MSWGERSCKTPCRVEKCTFETCNVDCPEYQWDGNTEPDSKPSPKVTEKQFYKSKYKDTRFVPALKSRRIGRNDLCPCGSGRKYKKCHGDFQSAKSA